VAVAPRSVNAKTRYFIDSSVVMGSSVECAFES
jgi:hypothetical protein